MKIEKRPLPGAEFDPDFYFALVAENLVRQLGRRAFAYAEIALQKMKNIGDQEGFELWQGIVAAMTSLKHSRGVPPGISIH